MSDSPLPPCKVLIVDDHVQNLELMEAYLELPGVTTVRAASGQEALARVAESPPDLILLDIMMPRMSGFEVCKKLKADGRTAHIPVLMVTALTEISDQERSVESGAEDFICKPVTRLDLIDRCARLLRDRRQPIKE